MKKLTGLLLFLFAALSAIAQKHERGLVQFSGVVHNSDSTGAVVPYVAIIDISPDGLVGQTNYKGYFSFVVHEQDTIKFSCVGYGNLTVIIPASVPKKSYTIQVSLKPQIANLPVFRVFPWATTEEFTKDFLTLKLADDDLAIARKNLSASSINTLERTLPRDGLESGGGVQEFHNNIVNSHYTTNTLLNPFAWGNLIKSISDGDKSRSADNTPPPAPAAVSGN
jgi:hypothetical protein